MQVVVLGLTIGEASQITLPARCVQVGGSAATRLARSAVAAESERLDAGVFSWRRCEPAVARGQRLVQVLYERHEQRVRSRQSLAQLSCTPL